jgi:hypothetical protein
VVNIKKYDSKKTRINKDIFENLCKLHCTESEISGVFDICEDTLNTWCKETYGETFSDTYKKKSASGNIALRRAQFRMAENNATMAIWLGKQYLGQIDKIEGTTEVRLPITNIEVVDNSKLKKKFEEYEANT